MHARNEPCAKLSHYSNAKKENGRMPSAACTNRSSSLGRTLGPYKPVIRANILVHIGFGYMRLAFCSYTLNYHITTTHYYFIKRLAYPRWNQGRASFVDHPFMHYRNADLTSFRAKAGSTVYTGPLFPAVACKTCRTLTISYMFTFSQYLRKQSIITQNTTLITFSRSRGKICFRKKENVCGGHVWSAFRAIKIS